jgi:hypothetical protein
MVPHGGRARTHGWGLTGLFVVALVLFNPTWTQGITPVMVEKS